MAFPDPHQVVSYHAHSAHYLWLKTRGQGFHPVGILHVELKLPLHGSLSYFLVFNIILLDGDLEFKSVVYWVLDWHPVVVGHISILVLVIFIP